MNKDVIYIEPEDDITDIITKIEKSKEKIVALVPPKKAGVFRSVVNIKLIAKSGASAEKTVVLVTTDPSIVKLAAATKLPVTKDLQTAPAIPKAEEAEVAVTTREELIEESDGTVETEEDVEELVGGEDDAESEDDGDEEEDDAEENAKKPSLKADKKTDADKEKDKDAKPIKKKSGKSVNKFVTWVKDHKKVAIASGVGVLILVVALVWALAIAPAVTVTVGIKTSSNNFSENVSFVTKATDEKASEGKFYIEEKKIESIQEVKFEATGKKNVGQKATGEVVVYTYIDDGGGTVAVSAGDTFTNSNLSYSANESLTFRYDGKDTSICDNANVPVSEFKLRGCLVSGRVKVTATEPGTAYNIAATDSGWSTTAPVAVYSDRPMTGGTDENITIVQQSDIDKAKEQLATTNESENKAKLLEQVGEDSMAIDASFKQVTADAISTPNVGEEVKDGEKATLKAVTTASIYVIDETKVKEFITEKADIKDDQKVYEMKDPFIENFAQTESGFTGKLKTSYATGPKLTESEVAEKIRGRGLGDAQHILRDIDGVTSVTMDTSFPWVTSVPGDTNKITVILDIKE